MKIRNTLLSFVFILTLTPLFTFGQGIIASSGAYIVANSGYVIVTGNVASAGSLNLQTGTFTTSGNYANSGTYTQGTGSVVFNGQNQVLSDNGSGTMFTNVFFSGNGGSGNPAVMSSGNFSVSSAGILNMISATSLNANGYLTLNSDATGSATVAAIPSGSNITGLVNVQRYLTGGTRGYRLLSSPVYASTVAGNSVYSINYLKNSMYLTATTTSGGFDNISAANPTLYLYRENLTPLYTTFLNSNFKGINNINSSPTYSMDDAGNPTINIPAGSGYLCFFRGNRASASFAAETVTSYVPQTVTLSTSGTLNQGQITVKDWFTPASANLSYTATSPVTVKGYNLVGNPYASSINWDTFSNTVSTAGIYGTSLTQFMYALDPVSKNYGTYQVGTGGVGTNNVTNIIASGQGFFVKATSTSAQLTFSETAKVNTQVTGMSLLMDSQPLAQATNRSLRLRMLMDSVNTDEIIIRFNSAAKTAYDQNEDAAYLIGSGQISLASLSADNISLAINQLPLPKQQAQVVGLKINTKADGIYSLNMEDVKEIPQLYDIWLMDAYKKDSLDMRHNATYSFNVIKSDTNTYGAKRFSLVIRQNQAYAYRLLDFTAVKAAATNTKQVQLVWVAENEQNYTNFTVERSTDDGKTFDVIGGFSSSGQGTYSLLDKSPTIGLNQYRLKQQDFNGSISYSKVIPLMYSPLSNDLANNTISVFPNPARNIINLTIVQNTLAASKSNTASYNITIIGSNGLIVKTANSIQALSQVNISNLLPGTYIIEVVNSKDKSLVGKSKLVKL